ncbi:organic anion transporter 3-like isoform X2 [Littorina saxatilis]|uniref:Major facilitator superfamily (MFS) profile domain-containing protein n=1 Tax=Littorina saxatilis TaxID=31220 RepID=A0AAN9GRQ0_9CAEN
MSTQEGSTNFDIDPVHRYLGAKGRFQLLQMTFISLGGICAQYQLFDVIFIGQDVPFTCAAPPPNVSDTSELADVTQNSSNIRYDECSIVVTTNVSGGVREESFGCLYGIQYQWEKDASFVSDFGLVCSSYLLVSLSQTFVVLGQGIGAFVASIISDRFGRKMVLLGSQLGLLVVGVAIGASPSYPFLALFKCLIGTFQQGVVTSIATMGIELFPREQRSLCALIINLWWAVGSCSMALFAYCLRHQSWRVLQYTLSGVSLLVVVIQIFGVDESLRWLVANGKKQASLRVLNKAARANKKDLDVVLTTLRHCQLQHDQRSQQSGTGSRGRVTGIANGATALPAVSEEGVELVSCGADRTEVAKDIRLTATRKLTLVDMFRHRRLRFNALLTFGAWFTVAFVVFTLYLMSTSYAGDPYLNYFLMALMEVPPAVLLFLGVDRFGRKRTVQGFYALAGLGCIASAICKLFSGNATLATMSAVFAMLGMVGGSGAFGGLFFYTPEYFPTNLRNQALGTGSTVGRVGGMIAPFMKNLALIVVWGPGVITGSLCVLVVISIHFLPETRGKELPTAIEDIEKWYSPPSPDKANSTRKQSHNHT